MIINAKPTKRKIVWEQIIHPLINYKGKNTYLLQRDLRDHFNKIKNHEKT